MSTFHHIIHAEIEIRFLEIRDIRSTRISHTNLRLIVPCFHIFPINGLQPFQCTQRTTNQIQLSIPYIHFDAIFEQRIDIVDHGLHKITALRFKHIVALSAPHHLRWNDTAQLITHDSVHQHRNLRLIDTCASTQISVHILQMIISQHIQWLLLLLHTVVAIQIKLERIIKIHIIGIVCNLHFHVGPDLRRIVPCAIHHRLFARVRRRLQGMILRIIQQTQRV
mmetsp:Transcript_10194/g.15453  ORF Transcript_10194/g.15453 Transcript_10194/m.15453 type:complete len:223 (-) Transcript_10194:640-1308(-)